MDDRKLSFETLAIHAGQPPDPTTGAVMTPVYLTSTYVQEGPGEHKGFEYSRTQNPTRDALEDYLAALEGARHGLAFASGLAATDAILHLLDAGDHVVASDDVYGGTFRLFDKVFRRHGLSFTYVDMSDPRERRARDHAATRSSSGSRRRRTRCSRSSTSPRSRRSRDRTARGRSSTTRS